jgi:hypothetical protein
MHLPKPQTAIEWVSICSTHHLHGVRELNGVGIRVHGYGVELKIGALTIDFDWGENGEVDGFDGWRLYVYALDNCPDIQFTHSMINEWIEGAVAKGELIQEDSLYYDPERRNKVI